MTVRPVATLPNATAEDAYVFEFRATFDWTEACLRERGLEGEEKP